MIVTVSRFLLIGLAIPAFAQESNLESTPVDADLWQSAWAAADTDGDGRLSREEVVALNPEFTDWFDDLDADGDGFISQEEALAGRMMRHGAALE